MIFDQIKRFFYSVSGKVFLVVFPNYGVFNFVASTLLVRIISAATWLVGISFRLKELPFYK